MLNEFLATGVFAFMLTFVRIGAAMVIMPGIGDTFTPPQVRLVIALGLSLVLAPFIAPSLPSPVPATGILMTLIGMEFIIGIFFGTVARVFMSCLDTAGMLISIQSGLGSAQLFNPAFASQGSLIGSFMTIAGIVMMFVTDFHHLLFYGLIGSYKLFPIGSIPNPEDMANVMGQAIASSFMVAVEIAAPFIVITVLVYIAMGVMGRLMPQIQVFMIAVPAQILLSFMMMILTFSAMMLFWLEKFQDGMVFFLGGQ